jgi:hypothetical protein
LRKYQRCFRGTQLQLQWEYEYHEDTDEIPTEDEMQKYGKHYNPPEYFFVVIIDGVKIGKGQESGFLKFMDTATIVINNGMALGSKTCNVTVQQANNSEIEFQADVTNRIELKKPIVPGPYEIDVKKSSGKG